MNIQRFKAASLPEAVQKVRRVMGSQAVILDTSRRRRGGLLGFFRRPFIEVVAAVEEQTTAPAGPESLESDRNGDTSQLQSVLGELEQQVGRIADQIEQAPVSAPTASSAGIGLATQPEVNEWLKAMRWHGVRPSISEDLWTSAWEGARHAGKERPEPPLVRRELIKAATDCIGRPRPLIHRRNRQVTAFIGPTGVGKTTTIAKLAAEYALNRDKRVALMTADTYRVAAIAQLETFGEMMDLPVLTVRTPSEIREQLARLTDIDLIFIDTAGRSHRDAARMKELESLLAAAAPDHIHLVLAAGTRLDDAQEMMSDYRDCGYDRLLFTKFDETRRLGLMLNLVADYQVPVSYVTNGQDVPDDLQVASPRYLARRLLKRPGEEGLE